MLHSLNETLSRFCSSKFWDSDLTWNTPDPDFTACFEKTFLVWIPCAFLWLLLPEQIYQFRTSRAARIPANVYNRFKVTIIYILMVAFLYDILTNLLFHSKDSSVDIYTPIIQFATLCLFIYLTEANRKYGIRSSGTLFLFSFLLALFGALEFRSNLRLAYKNEIYDAVYLIWYYPLVVALFFLNCFVDSRPLFTDYPVKKNVCPEYDVSFLSQIMFSWVDSFMWRGYKTLLKEDTVWNLDYEMEPEQIVKEFEARWLRALKRSKKYYVDQSSETENENIKLLHKGEDEEDFYECEAEEVSVLRPLCETYGWTFGLGITLKVLQSVLQFASPLILNLLMNFVSDENEYQWHGYFYAVLLLVIAFSQTILLMKHFQLMYRVGLQIRTALISVIYKKALKISNGARKNFTLGQIVNLMAVDAQRFVDLMAFIPLVWIVPLEIILALYFLWQILGLSVLAGLVFLIVLLPINGVIAAGIQKLQVRQMKRKDERIKLVDEILSGIKVLKLYAWEPSFEKQVTRIRDREVGLLRLTAYLYTGSSFIFACAPFLVSLVTFAAFVLVRHENVLTAQIAFVSLSLFNILRFPLTVLPILISTLVQSGVAIKRINKFLNSEEIDPQAVSHDPSPESIIVKDGQFSWDGYEGTPTLIDINLRVNPGALVAVVGSVGSGKSSLLSAFLGEMYKQSGSVNTDGRIAYVPQQAWIRNATVKNNILLDEAIIESRYNEVLKACALKPDLKILTGGDQTEIGEKGINLSGGQKQRISLARAVYSNSDIYLLDDPLSAVDANVGKHIFDHVIGPKGLLKDKTRILVTHGVTYLPQVDFIVVLQDGLISEAGTYAELMEREGDFCDFVNTYQTSENTESSDEEMEEEQETYHQKIMSPVPQMLDSPRFRYHTESNFEHDKEEDRDKILGQRLTQIELSAQGTVKWNVFAFHFKAASLFFVLGTISMNVLYQVFSVAANIWLALWSSDVTIAVDRADKQYLYLGVYAGFGLGQAISVVCQAICLYLGMLKASSYIHCHLLKSVLHWPVTTFDTVPSGRIINRFGFDVDVLDNVLPRNVLHFLSSTALVVSTLFMVSYSTPAFLSLVIPLGVIYVFVQRFYAATSRQMKRLESVSKSPVYSHFGETISGAASIRAYQLQSKFIQTSEDKVATTQKCAYVGFIANRWLAIRLELLGSIVVFFSALFVVLGRYTISASLVGLSVSYALQVTEDEEQRVQLLEDGNVLREFLKETFLRDITKQFLREITDTLYYWAQLIADTETNIVAVERIKEYSEVDQEAPWTLPEESVPTNWPNEGGIKFDDLRVRYRPGLELVLKGISFEVNSGEKVGIVGRTGAGKSSLTLSLFRLIEPTEGRIVIDGLDISSMGLHTLRSRLTIIPQDPVLFTGTLRMNLDPSEKYTDEHIWRALDLANLKTVVANLSYGLKHEVTEGGGNFSVGQRQLICLARALLRKTKILILDEATAAVDMETDDLIQATIRKEFADSTVLTIAHRLNTVMDYDRIVVLDDGRVVEFDSPDALLMSKKSLFSQMAMDADLIHG